MQPLIKLEGGDFANIEPLIEDERVALPKKRGRKRKMNHEDKPRAKMPVKQE